MTATRPAGRRALRCATVAAAVAAPVLIWLAAAPLLSHDLRVTDESTGRTLEIGLVPVAVLALVAALAGWAVLAVLERLTTKSRQIWVVAAVAVLLLSFLPLTGSGMTNTTRIVLAAMHLAVAAVLVPGLTRTRR